MKPIGKQSGAKAVAGVIVVLHEEFYLQCKMHGRIVENRKNPEIRNLARDLAENQSAESENIFTDNYPSLP